MKQLDRRVGITAALFMGLCGSVARGQEVMWELVGHPPGWTPAFNPHLLGEFMQGLGDFNGDGIGDFALASYPDKGWLSVLCGATGKTLFLHKTHNTTRHMVAALAGDVTGDGHQDLVIGEPGAGPSGFERGRAQLRAGATGALLHEWWGGGVWDWMGFAVAGGADFDGDGVPDVIVGAYGDEPDGLPAGANHGSVSVFSGATGELIRKHYGPPIAFLGLGYSVAVIHDFDGDGVRDYAAGTGRATKANGRVQIFSGATGELLAEILASEQVYPFSFQPFDFGSVFNPLSDLDGDGVADLAIADPVRGAWIFSGADLELIYQWSDPEPQYHFGAAIAEIGDVDGDGVPDIAVGTNDSSNGTPNGVQGFVRVFSGATGEALFEVTQPLSFFNNAFGSAIAGLGDVNGDGVADFAVGMPWWEPDGLSQDEAWGKVFVYSGADRSLRGSPPWIGAQSGGQQLLRVTAGPEQAGKVYLLLGSLSGFQPGLVVDGLTLPLAVDAYTQMTLTGLGGPLVQGGLGVLSASGVGLATLPIPSGLYTSFAGLTLWHAGAVLDPVLGQVVFTTNAAPLTLTP